VAMGPVEQRQDRFAATAGRYFDKVFLAVPLIELEPVTTGVLFKVKKQGGQWSPRAQDSYPINRPSAPRSWTATSRPPYQDELTFSVERELWPRPRCERR